MYDENSTSSGLRVVIGPALHQSHDNSRHFDVDGLLYAPEWLRHLLYLMVLDSRPTGVISSLSSSFEASACRLQLRHVIQSAAHPPSDHDIRRRDAMCLRHSTDVDDD